MATTEREAEEKRGSRNSFMPNLQQGGRDGPSLSVLQKVPIREDSASGERNIRSDEEIRRGPSVTSVSCSRTTSRKKRRQKYIHERHTSALQTTSGIAAGTRLGADVVCQMVQIMENMANAALGGRRKGASGLKDVDNPVNGFYEFVPPPVLFA